MAELVIGLVTRTEKTKYLVATGEYNKMIDARSAGSFARAPVPSLEGVPILLRRILRAAFLAVLVVIAALVGVGVFARFHDGPIGPFPGGRLVAGAPVAAPVTDWSFAAAIGTLELEVSPDHPRSVTTWFVVVDGVLYVPSASAAKKTWPGLVEQDGRVRVRVDGKLYELQATRVSDAAIGKHLSEAVTAKYGIGDGQPVEGAWAFALSPHP